MTSTCSSTGLIIETNVAFTIKNTSVYCTIFNVLGVFYTSPERFPESDFTCKDI